MTTQPLNLQNSHSPTAVPSPRFSVIVATYNYGQYLTRTLDSILSQAGDDFEVLVVDDGSTDQTRAVAERYVPRVRYLLQEHAGTFAACRSAYHAMRGRYAIFIDADDSFHPGGLAALRAAADAHPEAKLVLGRMRCLDEGGVESLRPAPVLPRDPMARFAAFARGRLPLSIAGALVDGSLLAAFDRPPPFDYPHGMDRAVAGLAMLHPVAQTDATTLDIYAHAGRLRDNIASIDASGLRLVDVLFDPAVLPPAAMAHRTAFIGTLERERARAYYRAGWHEKAWRSYTAAIRAAPSSLASLRNLRRALGSAARTLLRRPEGPVKSPPGHWLRGHHDAAWADPIRFFDEAYRTCAPVAMLRLRRRTYLVCEPADARHVLVSNDRSYIKAGILNAFQWLAGGMIGMKRPQHPAHRRVIQPAMQKRSIHSYAPMMIEVIDRHVRSWSDAGEFDAAIAGKHMSGEVAAAAVFGCRDMSQTMQLLDLVRQCHHCAVREMRRWIQLPAWLPNKRRRRYARLQRDTEKWLEPWINATLARGDDPSNNSMLAMMIHASPEQGPPTPAALRDRCMTLFTAGFEPVSVTLAWAMRLLAEHPHVQDRLAAEAQSVWGGRLPATEDVQRLTYATAVVSEVLRIYPSEALLTRCAAEDDRLPSGVRVRRGEEVMVSPRVFQHDPRYFPDPERFDPERFTGEPTWPADTFIPFGMGPRICIGEFFARLEMTLAISFIAAHWRIAPPTGPRPVLEMPNLFSTQPYFGHLMLRLIRRQSPPPAPLSA